MNLIFNLKNRHDWKEIEKSLNNGYIKILTVNKRNYLSIKDCYNRWWNLRYERIPKNIDWENYIPKRYDKTSNITKEQFYIDYKIRFRHDWKEIEKGLKEGYIKIINYRTDLYLSVKDRYNRWFTLFNLKNENIINWEDYIPTRYDKRNNINYKDFYIDYVLKLRDDWKEIKLGLENGYIRIDTHSNGHSLTLSVKDRYNRWWKLRLERIKNINWKDFIPSKYDKSCNLTIKEFFIDYTLKLRNDWKLIENGLENNYIRIIIGSNSSCKLEVKDYYNRWWSINNLSENNNLNFSEYLPTKYEPRMKDRYSELNRERFFIDYYLRLRNYWSEIEDGINNSYIKFHIDKMSKNIYIKVLGKDNNWHIIYNLSKYDKINYKNYLPVYSCFIKPYKQSKKIFSSNNCNLNFCNVILDKSSFNSDLFVSNPSIVWDLYSPTLEKSIYVGESCDFQSEKEALELYINNDYEGTKNKTF